VNGTFWLFYSVARTAAYTASNIKAAFRKTGIFPFNPDSVLTQLPSRSVPLPIKHQTILHLKTPHNRRDLRQHTQLAINHIKECLSGDTTSAIATLCHFTHTAETALTTAQIKTIEAEDIKKRYKGKTATKTNHRVITKACVITAEEVMKLCNAKLAKERVAAEKAATKRNQPATQNKRKGKTVQVLHSY
jgi:hypothetical protein